MIFKNFSDVLDEPMLYQIGIHLMPLYKNLCKLKIEELGVKQAVTMNTKSGRDQINPIYKEIREHIKIIQMMWRDIGLKGAQLPPPNLDRDDFKTTGGKE
ncbi:MAG: hypothetical protein GY861_04390 [bacterium]|nr:hypothetical protein [bacterium]